MVGSPGTVEPENKNEPDQSKNDKKSSWVRLRDFVTSTAGLMTGLATIVTAAATITGVLWHGSAKLSPSPTTIPSQGTTTIPAQGTATSSPEEARIQWGPGSLLLTNNGTSLTNVPPGNDEQVVGDVYVGGNSIEPFAGTILALWTSSGRPTAQQCSNLTTTQGAPEQGVNVVPGSVVCAATSEGPIAIIDVISFNVTASTIETRTTVWDLPGS
jgi:hypothetical protein